LISDLGELEAVGRLFHHRVAVYAGNPPHRMRAGLPVGLHSPLVTVQARFVLDFC
jgi:hypothetical protein